MTLKPWLRSVEQALFPSKCVGCARLFPCDPETAGASDDLVASRRLDFSRTMARFFCAACRVRCTPAASPLCTRCGLVFSGRQGADHYCGRCLQRPGVFSKARAAGLYDQSLRVAVQELKFNGRTALAKPLGALLFGAFARNWTVDEIDVVAPVPLHQRRFRQRGFNQAYLLLRHWPLPETVTLARDLLLRFRETAPQTGLDRRQRRRNLQNAFAMKRCGQSRGKRVLLIDDVMTTGATAEACARTLIADGARRVDVLTLARAV